MLWKRIQYTGKCSTGLFAVLSSLSVPSYITMLKFVLSLLCSCCLCSGSIRFQLAKYSSALSKHEGILQGSNRKWKHSTAIQDGEEALELRAVEAPEIPRPACKKRNCWSPTTTPCQWELKSWKTCVMEAGFIKIQMVRKKPLNQKNWERDACIPSACCLLLYLQYFAPKQL